MNMNWTNHPNALAAKVYAHNQLNTFFREMLPVVLAAITPFLGQNVCLAAGGWKKKFDEALPDCPSNSVMHSYINSSHGYSIWLHARVNAGVEGKSGQQTADNGVLIADLQNGVLSKVYEWSEENLNETFRVDYTEAEIISARAELKKAQDAVSAANRKLSGFGEYDR